MEILLDGNLILNKESLFKTLKEQISSDEFYGNSLDALWDVLSYGIDSLVVTIKNRKELEINLGDYFNKLIDLFEELNNKNVVVTFETN
jgi:RNAse (barnase) inhibitor barstar